MLVKEYRILLPLTVEEYRIAQLYMIQKKSRIDSHGAGSGVEIITNRPYSDGPGGNGQYTFKIYHIGSKIPVWIRSVLPTNALEAHEEAWNAYPYTKTRYSCPMMDRFSIEVETLYYNDNGCQENVFGLTQEEMKNRAVDVMDFVKDSVSSHDYCSEEDPKLYISERTGRGPLNDDWVDECIRLKKPIMCAYKLCKVEFRYWGMQTRAERWIHDLALRNTMMRAHRQAWAWQDEWYGLTMDDIRKLEAEVALHLSEVMAAREDEDGDGGDCNESVSSEEFFDCATSPPHSHKPSIIRWSSELLLNDSDSPPLTPAHRENAALLIMVFHGDFLPDNPADSKTTDTNTFRSTLETLILRHYPQLRDRVHVVLVSCGSELSQTVARLVSVSPTFGGLHPSLSLILSSAQGIYNDAVEGAIRRANEVYNEFLESQPGFSGEVFCVGDAVGGLLLYELLSSRHDHTPISRTGSKKQNFLNEPRDRLCRTRSADDQCVEREKSSRVGRTPSTGRPVVPGVEPIKEGEETKRQPTRKISGWSLADLMHHQDSQDSSHAPSHSPSPARPSPISLVRKKLSVESTCPGFLSRLNFQPSTAFLLGCPLGLVLMQRKLSGGEVDSVEGVQMFNLYYPLDPCGARLEPVLNQQLSLLPSANVPRYQRFPLGDGRSLQFDSSVDPTFLWGSKRIDHLLYCPNAMVALPSTALPNILHASYWESCDVGAFVVRQFVRGDESTTLTTLSASMNTIPLKLDLPPMQWKKKRTRFKITNLSPNHRANDVLVVSGAEQAIHARFCYGPMDLVALTRETVSIFVCPSRGEWFLHGVGETDSHGKLSVSLGRSLPCGIHSVKMVVHGDHSYLDVFVAVVPPETRMVVFSVDGSLTASVSVTGKDPRVRPGAVDVVRYWHDQGYLIVYVTARPDMQQRVVSAWLAQHNFPHALLFFTPSFSTDPLKAKTSHLRHLIDMGVRIHAAYGSSKDVAVYSNAGIESERIVSVSGSKRRGCTHIELYSQHLADLTNGTSNLSSGVCERQTYDDLNHGPNINSLTIGNSLSTGAHRKTSKPPERKTTHCGNVQRTSSFTPRSGKYDKTSETR